MVLLCAGGKNTLIPRYFMTLFFVSVQTNTAVKTAQLQLFRHARQTTVVSWKEHQEQLHCLFKHITQFEMLILAWANAHDYEIPFQAITAFVFHRKLYAAHILYAVDKINWEFGPQIIRTEQIWISDEYSGVFSPFMNMLLQAGVCKGVMREW